MPVWHEKTKALVASGELALVGIVHEQHPGRAALFAQWQQFDFPILWDPFGVTGLKVVPVITAVDAAGVVRLPRPDPRKFNEQFVPEFAEKDFSSVAEKTAEAPPGFVVSDLMGQTEGLAGPMARVLQAGKDFTEADVEALTKASGSPFKDFCAGVAHRMRYDDLGAQPNDFQSALSRWSAALHAEPNQYIWRRRIQQWGPRLDKPYPFYDWIDKATQETSARGEDPVTLWVPLSGSEIADRTKKNPGARGGAVVAGSVPRSIPEPDPTGKVARDEGKLVSLEIAVAQNTSSAGGSVRSPIGSSRVHLTLNPQAGAKWSLDADPPLVWVELPKQWDAAAQAFEFPALPRHTSERLAADFELSTELSKLGPPDENAKMPADTLKAYAVYSICLEDGTCVFRRQDFTIKVKFPAPPDFGPPPGDGEEPSDSPKPKDK